MTFHGRVVHVEGPTQRILKQSRQLGLAVGYHHRHRLLRIRALLGQLLDAVAQGAPHVLNLSSGREASKIIPLGA